MYLPVWRCRSKLYSSLGQCFIIITYGAFDELAIGLLVDVGKLTFSFGHLSSTFTTLSSSFSDVVVLPYSGYTAFLRWGADPVAAFLCAFVELFSLIEFHESRNSVSKGTSLGFHRLFLGSRTGCGPCHARSSA